MSRPPFPACTLETARKKVQAAEDARNTRDPERVAQAYTEDTVWRTRDAFLSGRDEVVAFLRRKWEREYALRKELWEFTEEGLMRRREASINDVAIEEGERRIFGPREPGDTSPLPLH